jgi:hypothetical protein
MGNHNYKLRYSQVIGIKEKLANTKTAMGKIAIEYGVSLDTVRKINYGEAHVDIGSFSHPIRKKKFLKIHDAEKSEMPRKISDDQAFEIMIRLDMGEGIYALAKEYGISHELIRKIPERPAFRHMAMYDDEF